MRDSSSTGVWGLHQLSFLAPVSGARNIQHISNTANIFWTVSKPVQIHSFQCLEAGLHPGLLNNLWKSRRGRRRGKWNFHFLNSVVLFYCHKGKTVVSRMQCNKEAEKKDWYCFKLCCSFYAPNIQCKINDIKINKKMISTWKWNQIVWDCRQRYYLGQAGVWM